MKKAGLFAHIFWNAVGLFGFLLLIFGGVAVSSRLDMLATFQRTEGRVIEFVVERSVDVGRRQPTFNFYYPVVSYSTQAGETITFRSRSGASPPAYAVGESVAVLYDPATPGSADIHGFGELWSIPIVVGCFSALFLGFWIIWWWYLLSGRRSGRAAATTTDASWDSGDR